MGMSPGPDLSTKTEGRRPCPSNSADDQAAATHPTAQMGDAHDTAAENSQPTKPATPGPAPTTTPNSDWRAPASKANRALNAENPHNRSTTSPRSQTSGRQTNGPQDTNPGTCSRSASRATAPRPANSRANANHDARTRSHRNPRRLGTRRPPTRRHHPATHLNPLPHPTMRHGESNHHPRRAPSRTPNPKRRPNQSRANKPMLLTKGGAVPDSEPGAPQNRSATFSHPPRVSDFWSRP